MEAWTFIDGMKIRVPLDRYDATDYGWHKGAGFKIWDSGSGVADREAGIREWCLKTFDRNSYTVFHDGVYFYREADALLCKLRWA